MSKTALFFILISFSSIAISGEIKTWTGKRKSNGGHCQAIYKTSRFFGPQLSLNFDLNSEERYETNTAPVLLIQELPETFFLDITQGTNPTNVDLYVMPFEWKIKANTVGKIRNVEFNGLYFPNNSSATPFRFLGYLKFNQENGEMNFKKIEQRKSMFGSYKTIFEDECLNMN
jgi:hypothetical protein